MRARLDLQQWPPPQHWPTFSSFNPYNSGFYGNFGQGPQANEFIQLQQMVKNLEEKLATVSSTPQENKQISYVDSREVSLKKKRCLLHEISDSEDAL